MTGWRRPPILSARGLVRVLGAEVKQRVVDHVSLDVWPGEFVALTGASGSGKSTLLYLLGLLDRADEGTLVVDGVDVGALDDDARARFRSERLGYIFQFHFLLPEFTVLENVVIPLRKRGVDDAQARRLAEQTLAPLGLADLAKRRPGQLSGGQQQRVAIARAIAGQPRVLLADEPTGALDSASGEAVMQTFERLVRELGITLSW